MVKLFHVITQPTDRFQSARRRRVNTPLQLRIDLGIRTLLFIHPLPGANRVLYGTPVTRNNRCLLQPSAVCTAVRKTRTTYPPRTHITPASYNAGHVRHKLGPEPSKLLLFLLLFRRCQIMGVLQNIVRMWGL